MPSRRICSQHAFQWLIFWYTLMMFILVPLVAPPIRVDSEASVSAARSSNPELSREQRDAVDNVIYGDTRRHCDMVDDSALMRSNQGSDSTRIVQKCFTALTLTVTDPSTRQLSEQLCDQPTRFHTVWVGEVYKSVRLGLMSIIYSHPPGCVEVNLWTIKNDRSRSTPHEIVLPHDAARSVHVRDLNGTALMMDIHETFPSLGSLLEERENIFLSLDQPNMNLPAYSDAIRFLLLAAYGGVYVDADVLVMRSFQPLLSRDFWYRWSTQSYCNTAVLHMKKGSPNAFKFLAHVLEQASDMDLMTHLFHPMQVSRINLLVQGTMEMLPSAYFDPSWAMYDLGSPAIEWAASTYGMAGFTTFFNDPPPKAKIIRTPQEFFSASFAYHWHNQWTSEFQEQSVAAVFASHFEAMAASNRAVLPIFYLLLVLAIRVFLTLLELCTMRLH